MVSGLNPHLKIIAAATRTSVRGLPGLAGAAKFSAGAEEPLASSCWCDLPR